MAEVTIELRMILRMKDFELFDFDYPIADPMWKEELERLIKDYYFFYEIGSETIDRFKHTLKTRMNLIMPYYNELYLSRLFDIDPMLTQRIRETYDEEGSGSESRSVTGESERGTTSSIEAENTGSITNENNLTRTEYPQSTNIENDIPTERNKEISENESTGASSTTESGSVVSSESQIISGTNTGLKNYNRLIEGLQGDPNELIRSYRQNIININKMIVDDLKTLFILVY